MDNQGRTEERRIKKNIYSRAYRSAHKGDIASQRSVRTTCSCGHEVPRRHLAEHLKKRRHAVAFAKLISLLEEKTNPDVAKYIAGFLE